MKSKHIVKAGSYPFTYNLQKIADTQNCITAHLDGEVQTSRHVAVLFTKIRCKVVSTVKLSDYYDKVTQTDKRYPVAL